MQSEDSPIRVLVIEDDAFSRLACVEYLKSLGHDVVSASTGEQALDHATDHVPDVVVCDWQLGDGMNGVDVAKSLSTNYDPTIIMVTGQPLPSLKAETRDLPVEAYFRKPVSLPALHEAILATRL